MLKSTRNMCQIIERYDVTVTIYSDTALELILKIKSYTYKNKMESEDKNNEKEKV